MLERLQYISQGTTSKEQFVNVQSVLDGGCKWIQLRVKNTPEKELFVLAEQVKKYCDEYKAVLIVNDYPHLAKEVEANGVHLGLTDGSIMEAKNIMGKTKLVGGSANTMEDVLRRVEEGCDYVGLGPYRFTTTKEKLSPVLGVQGYEKIMNVLRVRNNSIPVYAIGGIELEDVVEIRQTGIYGVAVSGVLTHHPNKKIVMEQFNHVLYETINDSQ